MAQYPDVKYRSLQASSYNRKSISPDQPGWFADSDGIGYVREEIINGEKEFVIMEHAGPGCLTRLWTPFFYYSLGNNKGPNIRVYLDGKKKPVIDECFIDLVTGKGSVKPPFASFTARAGDLFLPIPFSRDCKITLSDKPFYFIVNYRAYDQEVAVKSFTKKQFKKASASVAQTAEALFKKPSADESSIQYTDVHLGSNEDEIIDLHDGENSIRQLSIRLDPESDNQALRSTILEMTFDGVRTVWCPVGDFFSSPDKINPFQVWNRTVLPDGTMICRYVMPYKKTGQVRLINLQDKPVDLKIGIENHSWNWNEQSMHFYASWKPVGTLSGDKFTDLNFIDIKGKGVLVGDALTVLSPDRGWWGEGDEKIYIDEADMERSFPSHFGTGTEDYYGWAGGLVPTGRDTFSIPIGGNICNGNPANPRGYNICARNRILDVIPFTNRLVFDMEASPGTDIRNDWNLLDYTLVSFWYAIPGSTNNSIPLPEKARKPILSLNEIDLMQDYLKNGTIVLNPPIPYQPKEHHAQPGQFLVYHVCMKAETTDFNDIKVQFSDLQPETRNLQSATGNLQPATRSRFTCFNLGGINFMGQPFTKRIDIPAGQTQELWMGLDLEGIPEGVYTGAMTISSGDQKQEVPIKINVSGKVIKDHGYDKGKTMARLNWLNSTVGIDEKVTKGFTPVELDGNLVKILGRELVVGVDGLPTTINSFFGPSNQELKKEGEDLLKDPMRFIIEKADGSIVRLKPGKLEISSISESKAAWRVISSSLEFDLECSAQMEFDGFVDYKLTLTARTLVKVKDIRLEILVTEGKAEYMMGLGHEGGTRLPDWRWKWDVTKNQDMLWIGAVNGGMRIKWKAANYRRPLINIYYEFGQLNMPPSWCNGGKGGVNVIDRGRDVLVKAYSGQREMIAGETLDYDFEILLTPFRTVNKSIQYGDRYYHGGGTNTSVKIADAKSSGANIINIHHAEDLYPFINYPYLDENIAGLKKLVSDTHDAGMRMKFYYTTRELTKNLPEFKAFYSLDGEIIYPGPGDETKTILNPNGPHEWLKKNLHGKYIPAWHNPINEGIFKGETDLSVITTPDSRLNNFYVAGLDWMVRNIGIDGVYIDDSALDRFTLMRARKIIDKDRPEGRIDLHSWNHFNKMAGFTNCLNLYMDLLPYFDQVWIGEGRDYNRMPDHWLIEVSGIPFGLPGQMLQGGGNPWRGMVYGITNRAGWTPRPPGEIWKFWDEYGIQDKEMITYWDKNCPVRTSNPMVKATVYRGSYSSIISIANWSDKDQKAGLSINWASLGLDPDGVDIFIPSVIDFQERQQSVALDKLTIPGGKGYLIIIRER